MTLTGILMYEDLRDFLIDTQGIVVSLSIIAITIIAVILLNEPSHHPGQRRPGHRGPRKYRGRHRKTTT